jgi:hypothetical protein
MGAISVINLSTDAGFVQLQSDIFLWLESYRSFVIRVGNFLFGWIEYEWLNVSTTEIHALALSIVVGMTVLKTQVQLIRSRAATKLEGLFDVWYSYTTPTAMPGNYGPFFVFPTLAAIVLPDPYGWRTVTIFVMLTLTVNVLLVEQLDDDGNEIKYRPGSLVGRLVGTHSIPILLRAFLGTSIGSSGPRFRTNLLIVVVLAAGTVLLDAFLQQALRVKV